MNISVTGKKRWIIGGILAVVMAAGTANAGTTYTSQGAFTAVLNPGAETENFSDFSDYSPDGFSATLTNGTYTGVVTAQGLFGDQMVPFTQDLDGNPYMTVGGGDGFAHTLTLTFTSGNVNAIGGSFFYTSGFGDIVDAPITLTFSDGTSQVLNNQNNSSFFGYVGSASITSLTITSDSSDHFGSLDNLIIGSASTVPEPASFSLLVLGGMLLLLVRRRARQ